MDTIKRPMVECVPNFSEGRNGEIIAQIAEPFKTTPGVRLLDCQQDEDHNRLVITAMGEAQAMRAAVTAAAARAVALIDMNTHRGQHPRMGAVDVIPFVPLAGMTMAAVVALAEETAAELAERLDLPVFLYEAAARRPERKNLAVIRQGEFEGLFQKLQQPDWQPDFGPHRPHPTAGAVAVGARPPLIAFNVNLHTDDLEIARKIAAKVRHISGGLRHCKAMGVELKNRHMVQVSMNLTDYTQTALYTAFELIRVEARRYGVSISGSEIVGLVPMAALVESAGYYLGLENFSLNQVMEARLLED